MCWQLRRPRCQRLPLRHQTQVSAVIGNKCTKQQFIRLLTAAFKDLHIKNSKNHKKVILPASHWLCVNVLLINITFLWFLLFLMCKSLNAAVNKCINCCFVHLSSVKIAKVNINNRTIKHMSLMQCIISLELVLGCSTYSVTSRKMCTLVNCIVCHDLNVSNVKDCVSIFDDSH